MENIHGWYKKKTGKVGTSFLQPKPTPAQIKTGKAVGSSDHLWPAGDQQDVLGVGFV